MAHPERNVYSRRWFEFFHIGIGEARTMQETASICRCAPLPNFCKVLDVCCGMDDTPARFRRGAIQLSALNEILM